MNPKRLALLLAAGVVVAAAPVALAGAPGVWLVLLAVGALAGVSPGGVGRRVSLLAVGLTAYVGGMALTWSALGALAAAVVTLAVSFGAFWLRRERAVVVVIHLAIAAALVLCWVVLLRSGMPAAASRALALLGGLSVGGLAALCWLGLLRLTPSTRLVSLAVAVLCGIGAFLGEARLPAWRQEAEALTAPAQNVATHVRLQRLRTAGFRDAALAWAGMCANDGFELRLVARLCPSQHHQTILPPAWQPWIAQGAEICARLSQARPHTPPAPATPPQPADSWQAWNHALALWLTRAPQRAGVSFRGSDKRYSILLDSDLGAYVLAVAAVSGGEVQLPPVPVGAAPPALHLRLRAGPSFRVSATTQSGGAIVYACASTTPGVRALNARACRGRWDTLSIEVGAEEPLTGITLSGEFALAEARAVLP
ncbi:MAG: hypothetical protein HYZ27_07285 [Deltaproteobacteria bacterium]|nr:hypothetical protein [Deltaproteobacteria bacterium]